MASVEDATRTMIANLEKSTGKSLAQWVEVARKSGKEKHGDIVTFLKTKHDMGHGYANLVVHSMKAPVVGAGAADGDGLVDAQYAGAKAGLRPIYDALVAKIESFGSDVEIAPKKAYVSVRRSKQFAILQPSTAARFDVGLNLKGAKATGRLEASGSFNSMVSHRVRVEKAGDVDKELVGWLKQAYDSA